MAKREPTTIYELLKTLGLKSERDIKKIIHDRLNNEETIKLINLGLRQHTESLKSLRRLNNVMAQQLNIPTKDDLANVANLAIQMEEKLDLIEEKLSLLVDELKEVTQETQSRGNVSSRRKGNTRKQSPVEVQTSDPVKEDSKIEAPSALNQVLNTSRYDSTRLLTEAIEEALLKRRETRG